MYYCDDCDSYFQYDMPYSGCCEVKNCPYCGGENFSEVDENEMVDHEVEVVDDDHPFPHDPDY